MRKLSTNLDQYPLPDRYNNIMTHTPIKDRTMLIEARDRSNGLGLLTPEQVAAVHGISFSTFRIWARDPKCKKLPQPVVLNRTRLYPKAEVEALARRAAGADHDG